MMEESLRRGRSELQVLGACCTRKELVEAAAQHQPAIALISLRLEEGPLAGLEALQELVASCPKTRPIIMLDEPEPDVVVQAFRAGARGVFSRSQSMLALRKCIMTVNSGQIWIANSELEYLLNTLANTVALKLVNAKGEKLLTMREEHIVSQVAAGLTNAEIAEKLNISQHTVKNHLFRIFDKLGISNRVELILYAVTRKNGQ